MKAAIIGTGRMGRRHIEAARRAGLDICGVFDISRDSLQLARDEQKVPERLLFDELESLYAIRPEVVVVSTTADSHCELACMAAERGAKFVLLEKPMAVSLEQCDRIIETCARRGVGLAVNHQMRFMEQYSEPKRLAATEEFGGIESMTVVGGNFGFAMLGTHYFEQFRLVTGEKIAEVSAWFSPERVANPRGPQFEDRAGSIRAATGRGRRLYIDAGSGQGHGIQVVYACRFGQIQVDGLTGELRTTVRQQQHRDLPTTRYGMPATVAQWKVTAPEVVDSTASLLKALFAGRDYVSGEDGRSAVEALVAAYESANKGGVTVSADAGLDRKRMYPWA